MGPEVPPEEMWNRLAHAIEQIQQRNVSRLSYEEHYRYGYSLVLVSEACCRRRGQSSILTASLFESIYSITTAPYSTKE